MKVKDKFPHPIDLTKPRLFDRIVSVAQKMRAERRLSLSAEVEERREAQERALTAVRRREAIEAIREAEAIRKAALSRAHVERERSVTPDEADVAL
jgi:hypothetical protein